MFVNNNKTVHMHCICLCYNKTVHMHCICLCYNKTVHMHCICLCYNQCIVFRLLLRMYGYIIKIMYGNQSLFKSIHLIVLLS